MSKRSEMALTVSTQHLGATVALTRNDACARPAPTVATYRRRRLAALLAAAAAAVLLVAAANRAAATFRDVPASVSERRPVPEAAAAARSRGAGYLVQSGDTLWSIARRLQPRGDVRPLVDALVRLNGGAALEVGQHIVVP
jgi:Tfp pilus assembly protein FimV